MPPFFFFSPSNNKSKGSSYYGGIAAMEYSGVSWVASAGRLYKIKELHDFYVDGDKVCRPENETDRLLHFNWLLISL